jgi:hypothetical protein
MISYKTLSQTELRIHPKINCENPVSSNVAKMTQNQQNQPVVLSFGLLKYEIKLRPTFKRQLRCQKVTNYFQLFSKNRRKVLSCHLADNILKLQFQQFDKYILNTHFSSFYYFINMKRSA